MSTKKISIGISEEVIPMDNMKVRVVFSINSMQDEEGNTISDDKLKLFMYHKPTTLTEEVPVEDCSFVSLFPIHIFNELEKPEFGSAYPAIHSDLPETTIVIGADDRVDSASVPADAELGYFVTDRYIASRCAIFEGYGTAASEFRSNIREYLTAFAEYYEAYMNGSTLVDITTYPTGWEGVLV